MDFLLRSCFEPFFGVLKLKKLKKSVGVAAGQRFWGIEVSPGTGQLFFQILSHLFPILQDRHGGIQHLQVSTVGQGRNDLGKHTLPQLPMTSSC